MSVNSKSVVIILDTSIKNQVTILIVYVYTYNSFIIKIIHQVINVTLTETELFAIKYSIFFLNRQFITWHAKADRGSYFCNYIQ